MFGNCKKCQKLEQVEEVNKMLLTLLDRERAASRAEVRDLLDELRDLTSKILALAQPAALRELRRTPTEESEPLAKGSLRPHFPGFSIDRRPPVKKD